ncbi:hypothetical protein BH23CHL4_BH23CHL4_21850 [soil metagenome]
MEAAIDPDRWLQFIGSEYLDSFIKAGGASVKFAVPLDEFMRSEIELGLAQRAQTSGYLTAHVSSADTRVHLIDQVFYRMAEQIPWRQLSEHVIISLAAEKGFAEPTPGSAESLAGRLAESNMIDPDMVTMEARRWIGERVFRNQLMVKDFRVAMMQLCLAALAGGSDGETTVEVITDWLTGRNKLVSAVKPYQIFTRISRTNARYLFESLLHWIRFAGLPGLVVTMDLSRLTVARNPRDEKLFYSRAQLLDAYEVLRQFVDLTDKLIGCFIVAMPAAGFLDVESSSPARGLGVYDALKFRVYDEVHDQRLVNPMGALIRLRTQGSAF